MHGWVQEMMHSSHGWEDCSRSCDREGTVAKPDLRPRDWSEILTDDHGRHLQDTASHGLFQTLNMMLPVIWDREIIHWNLYVCTATPFLFLALKFSSALLCWLTKLQFLMTSNFI